VHRSQAGKVRVVVAAKPRFDQKLTPLLLPMISVSDNPQTVNLRLEFN
jgi:hypothetical protein